MNLKKNSFNLENLEASKSENNQPEKQSISSIGNHKDIAAVTKDLLALKKAENIKKKIYSKKNSIYS